LYHIQIYNHSEYVGNASVTLADSGTMRFTDDKKFLEITLFNGTTYSEVLGNRNQYSRTLPFRRDIVGKQVIRLELKDFGLKETDNSMLKQGHQMMNIFQLQHHADSLDNALNDRAYYLKGVLLQRFEYLLGASRFYLSAARMPVTPLDGFRQLGEKERTKALETALYYARTVAADAQSMKPLFEDQQNASRRYRIEWHNKLSLSFACLVFFFVGAPLGAIIRKGGLGTPVLVAVMFFILFYVIMIIGKKSAQQGVILPWEGMWLAPAVLLPIGIFLLYQATRDSTLMTSDLYKNIFKRLTFWLFPQTTHVLQKPSGVKQAADLQMIAEDLRNLNREVLRYMRTRISKAPLYHEIWITSADPELAALASRHHHLRTALEQVDHPSVWEQMARNSGISFEQPGIPPHEHWKKTVYTLLFPAGLYLWVKVVIQRARLRMSLLDLIKQNNTMAGVLSGIILEGEDNI